jgi:hypothetical protein
MNENRSDDPADGSQPGTFQPRVGEVCGPPRRTITAQLTKMLAQELMVPPINFACVCKGVYRSGYPNLRNLPFLKKLGLKSIL